MHLRRRMSPNLLRLQKQQRRRHRHKRAAPSLPPKHPKLNRAVCGAGSLVCSAAARKKKPRPLSTIKSQASVVSVAMAAAPMAEVAVVVAVAAVVTAPKVARRVVIARSVPHAVNAQSAGSAM